MNVCFLTLGTRGDVQPYLALAKYVVSQGHSAVICTSGSFKELIENEGVQYKKATLDLMSLSNTEIGKKVLEHPIRNLSLTLKLSKELVTPAYRKTFDDFYQATLGADILVYHPKALVAVDIAEKLGIPCVNMCPIPMIQPITEFPCIAVSGNKDFGAFFNQLTYSVNKQNDSSYMKSINDFREKTLKLKKRKSGIYTYFRDGSRIPIVYPISQILFEDTLSWKNEVFLSGFFFLDTKVTLSKEVETFLSKGDKPILITFSSMPVKEPVKFIKMLEVALSNTNNRAVMLIGNSGIEFETTERIFVSKSEPHSQLFPKAKAVIHHGGVGTTATSVLSCVPQLINPFSVDQPFWAKRMYEQGVALEPVKMSTLNKEQLTLIMKRFDDTELKQKAVLLGSKIEKENGLENALKFLLKCQN